MALTVSAACIKNLMRLSMVDVQFDEADHLVVIGGRNEQGKTSFLDIIQGCFVKGKLSDMPIHEGAKRGESRIELAGDDGTVLYTITKVYRPSGTEVTVCDQHGKALPDARALLDDLTANGFGLDPAQFARQCTTPEGRRQQFLTLKQLAGIDLTKLDTERAEVFEARKEANGEVRRLEAALGMLSYHDNAPETEIDAEELTREYADATDRQAEFESLINRYNQRKEGMEKSRRDLDTIEAQIEELQQKAAQLTETIELDREAIDELRTEAQALQTKLVNREEIVARMQSLQKTNREVRENQQYRKAKADLEDAADKAASYNTRLQEIDAEKASIMATATMPIEGLALSEEDATVLYRGKPLSVASSAEQLRVSTAVGIAMLKDLKLILIRDGSLLDHANKRMIAEMAAAAGVQVLMECVGVDGASFVIEDGTVADAETVQRLLDEEQGVSTVTAQEDDNDDW